MWCCKRLDASDWPVTTVVRGNISCLHVAAAAASLTFETPIGCCSRDFLSSSFLSLFSFTGASSASSSRVPFLHCFFAAPRETREKERMRIRIPAREETGGDEGRTVSTRNGSSGRRPSRVARILARRRIAYVELRFLPKYFPPQKLTIDFTNLPWVCVSDR